VTAAAALTLVCAHAVFQAFTADIKKTKNDATLIFGYVVVNIGVCSDKNWIFRRWHIFGINFSVQKNQ